MGVNSSGNNSPFEMVWGILILVPNQIVSVVAACARLRAALALWRAPPCSHGECGSGRLASARRRLPLLSYRLRWRRQYPERPR